MTFVWHVPHFSDWFRGFLQRINDIAIKVIIAYDDNDNINNRNRRKI